MKILTSLIFLFALVIGSFAQDFDRAKLDQLLDALAAKNKAMGSLTVAKNGNVVYSRAIGYSRFDDKGKTPSDAKTKYRIGSISKMFTATLIFQLVDEGKIKLNDTLDKFFPEIPNAKNITIAQMLNHHSGIHNFTDDAEFLTYLSQPKTEAEMLAIIAKSKPDFEPGAKGNYSNSNYVLLGYIVEKITKKPYKDVLKEKIVSKINLTDTYYGGKINNAADESFSYRFVSDWEPATETDMSIPGGAGAIVSTPTDLTKFIDALFGLKLISQKSLDQMTTLADNYGMGIFEYPIYGKKAFGHTGGIDGFNSMLIRVPEDNLSIAYASNGMVYPVNDIMLAAYAVASGLPYAVPTFESFAVTPEELDALTGVYSTAAFPLKITVTRNGSALYAQATGQSAFPLEATERNKFKFDAAGIVIEFDREKNQMTLTQGGAATVFTKEK